MISAFTTITSTPSFAPLALTLLALLARIYNITGVTTFIGTVGDQEEKEQLAQEEEEMQEALARFAKVDALGLWDDQTEAGRNEVENGIERVEGGYAKNTGLDVGVVVSREEPAKSTRTAPTIAAKQTEQATLANLASSPSTRFQRDSGFSRPASPAPGTLKSTPKVQTVSGQYESKIRSSPLVLPLDESVEPKRAQIAPVAAQQEKKRKMANGDSDRKRPGAAKVMGKKKKKKPRNEIDALFAGLG